MRLRRLRDRSMAIWPGFLISVMIALATSFLSDHYGGPEMLYALLFGMVLHFLSDDSRVSAGIEFTARTVLRFGVARSAPALPPIRLPLSGSRRWCWS